MTSIWERMGEGVGYAIGAVIFGPSAAIARRERRTLRNALHEWADSVDATHARPHAKGLLRYTGALRGSEPIPFEAELDPFEKRATLDVAIGLAKKVEAEVSKARWALDGVKVRLPSPFAHVGTIRVDDTTLDADTAETLAREIAETPIGALETFSLTLRSDRVVVVVMAPRAPAEWRAIEKALVVLVESWSRRWAASYR
jgi:hypothetical protein